RPRRRPEPAPLADSRQQPRHGGPPDRPRHLHDEPGDHRLAELRAERGPSLPDAAPSRPGVTRPLATGPLQESPDRRVPAVTRWTVGDKRGGPEMGVGGLFLSSPGDEPCPPR